MNQKSFTNNETFLFDSPDVSPFLDFEFESSKEFADKIRELQKISLSGMQEKFPGVVEKGRIILARKGERSTHILKPAPWDETLINRKEIPVNEYLTMQIASKAYGIETAINGLCFTPKGRPVYVARRFDLKGDGSKKIIEDFSSLAGKDGSNKGSAFKYEGSYIEIARILNKLSSKREKDLGNFFRLVVFNYLYANGDAHLKNFSTLPSTALQLIENSPLTKKTKRNYLRILNERLRRFNR